MTFDPRTISKQVYEALDNLKTNTTDKTRLKEQKNQALEIYTYLSTWGLMRLKAEELALSQQGKKDTVKEYFKCLQEITQLAEESINISGENGLKTIKDLDSDRYLGLTGLGLEVAQEFSFWANAIYHDVKAEAN